MRLFSILFLFCLTLHAENYIIPMPKAGTHLVKRIFNMLKIEYTGYKHPGKYKRELNFIHNHPDDTFFFLIRDPRDLMISLYDATHTLPEKLEAQGRKDSFFAYRLAKNPSWETATFEEKLLDMILISPSLIKTKKIHTGFRIAKAIKDLPNVHILKFEDLVGEKGGGSTAKQRATFLTILEHAQSGDPTLVDYTIENGWGLGERRPGETFHIGRLGRWKEKFNESHIEAIKTAAHWNDFLLTFDYEKEPDW